ncbi:MAG: efflux RND transporter periplasmic adaptor subunit [Myxococcota bacterium]
MEVEPTEAALELDLPGEVGGQRDANLAAANGGFVERVLVAEGDAVTEGQALAYVDVGLYQAGLDQATAQLDQARSSLGRVEKLGDMAADAQLEQARTQEKVAAAAVAQAQTRLSRAVIRSPFAGVVADVAVERGEAVPPGSPVIRVVQLDPAVVELSVSDRDVVSLVPGTAVTVTATSRTQQFEGTVTRVSPAADLRTRAFPVEVEVPNPDRLLLPGMIARVKVERPVQQEAVVIPQDWLVTRRDERGVFVVVEGTAIWRPVELGDVIHDRVVVREGLQPGERVVITGHRDLVDGDPLVISREGRCCSKGRPDFDQVP